MHDKRRYTLAVRFVRKGESMDTVVRWLLDRLKRLKIRLRRVYLDAGFASVPVLRSLRRRRLTCLLPLPLRGRSGGVRVLFTGRHSYRGYYTLNSHTVGTCRIPVVVVLRYYKVQHLMSHSPAGIRLQVVFTGLAANVVRWCILWLKDCSDHRTPKWQRTLNSSKHLVQVAANCAARVEKRAAAAPYSSRKRAPSQV